MAKLGLCLALVLALVGLAFGRSVTRNSNAKKSQAVTENSKTRSKIARGKHPRRVVRRVRRHRRWRERFYTSSFANDATAGDTTAGEDPVVRAAALEALGNMNGSVVAIDPGSGRILAMVNQKLALSEGAQPCSTIKLAVALAALKEGLVSSDDTALQLTPRWRMDLNRAMAVSNNTYFEVLGRKLGFEKVASYAHSFGLGELAGWNIQGEHLGEFPGEELAAKFGGVGKMCSFGESISMTPLQLGALVAAIANGGTLYYLQYPRTADDVAAFKPMVKRQLEIAEILPAIEEGMTSAVAWGTARTVHYNFSEEQVLGKTGTCSKDGTRYGWFASYANTQYGRIAVVVFLRGGRPTYGPKAAEIAGRMYRNLYDHSFFAAGSPVTRTGAAATGVSQ